MPRSDQRKRRGVAQLERASRANTQPRRGGPGAITLPEKPVGVIILPVTVPLSGSSAGLRRIAAGLQDDGFAAFLSELLAPAEVEHGYHNFDFELLADRVAEITERLRRQAPFEDLPIGYFGTSTDAAAMAIAASRPDCPAAALVMCAGRPELAAAELPRVNAPTLFIVEDDELALDLNRGALAKLRCPGDLVVLPGLRKGLAAPAVAAKTARLAGHWFKAHLGCWRRR